MNKSMEKIKFIILPIFGLASALLINATLPLITLVPLLGPAYFYIITSLPGIIFGIFIALSLFIINREKNTPEQILIWLAICATAYHASFWVLITLDIIGAPFAFFIASSLGGLMMLTGLNFIAKISKNNIIFLSILAGLIAFAWILIEYNTTYIPDTIFTYTIDDFLTDKMENFDKEFSYLYIWWNTLMAFGISIVIKNKLPKKI